MPRQPRHVFPGVPHHITQRGSRRGPVFFCDADRRTYLWWLRENCRRHRVQILAYCLMTNHVHFVAVPPEKNSLERVFRPLHTHYSRRVNRPHDWVGALWQGRPFAAALGEAQVWTAIRYVERNPVRAGMVNRAENYPWSSAQGHCGLRDDPLLAAEPDWLEAVGGIPDWAAWVADAESEKDLEDLRRRTQSGHPCGSDAFVKALERQSGLRLGPGHRGRPRKT